MPSEAVLNGDKCFPDSVAMEAAAPDFTADAYHLGKKVTIKLSDYRNKWVVLFFYSNDFTFV